MATLQERLDEANRKIDHLEAEASDLRQRVSAMTAEAGRDIDDRFRSAVDPIGHRVEDRLDLQRGSAKDPMRIAGWIVVILIIAALGYFIYRASVS